MDNNHVVIVTYHMIPNTKIWGASQRMYYMANQLADSKFDVTVIHANFGSFNTYNDKEFKFKSIKIDIRFRFLQQFQENIQNSEKNGLHSPNKIISLKTLFSNSILKPLYRKFETFIFNDYGFIGLIVRFWTRDAWPHLNELLAKKNVKLVIISGPYFASFNLICKIKKNYPNTLVALDYRDPWNLNNKGSFITNYFEQKYIKLADILIFFSEKFKNAMCKKFSFSDKEVMTIYNGYDERTWQKIHSLKLHQQLGSQSKRLVISYVSSHVTFIGGPGGRDIRTFIEAVSASKYANQIELKIVGCHDYPPSDWIKDSKILINYFPVVSHEKALEFTMDSDVNIVLISDPEPSSFILSGKLFDCIRSENYILGIANSRDIGFIEFIDQLNLGSSCKNEHSSIQVEIDNIFALWKRGDLKKHHNFSVDEYSRSSQNKKLISFIQD